MTMVNEALAKAVASREFYVDCWELLRQLEMTNVERNTFDLLDKFFLKYERMPTREELLLFTGELPEQEQKHLPSYKEFVNVIYNDNPAVQIEGKVLHDKIKEKVSKQRIKDKIVHVADTFDHKTAQEIMSELEGLVFSEQPMNQERRVEVDVTSVKENIPIVRYQSSEKIPTMLAGLDHMLYGGIGVRELTCVVAPSSRGKTAFLINLMHGFLLQGQSVLYISLEMSVVDILRRLYRRILYKDKTFLAPEYEATMMEWLTRFFGMSKSAGKVLYYPANMYSCEDLKVDLMRMELQGDFYPNVIIIDHLDLMTSKTKSIRQKESWQYWRMVVDDLREIPLSRGIPIITATQGTRLSSTKAMVSEIDVGESYGKVQSSDVVLSLNQTPEEYENKRIRVGTIKNRDYIKGTMTEFFSDMDMMLMCDIVFAQKNGWA